MIVYGSLTGNSANVTITFGGDGGQEPPPAACAAPVPRPKRPGGPPVLAAVRAPDGEWEVPVAC
jgi:hypothetical protein